jgi:guanylate kinase
LINTIILSGPSGIGKNTFIEDLEKLQKCFNFVTPITTRSIRANEVDGVHYHFISKEEFREMIVSNSLIEWDYILNNYYGFKKKAFSHKSNLMNITHALAKMALRIKKNETNIATIFLEPNCDDIIKNRLSNRENTNDVIERIKHGKEELEHKMMFDYIVIGTNTQEFKNKFIDILIENNNFKESWLDRCKSLLIE